MASAQLANPLIQAAHILAAQAANDANMLVPQAYDAAWTELAQNFNEQLSPGTVAALSGEATPVDNAAVPEAAVEVTNFPSHPNAPGDRDWLNPQSAAMIAVGPSSQGLVLGANPKRTLLIIQNNSASSGATFWIAFGTPAVQYNSIALAPGASLTLDAACPRDAVYILITGAAGVTGGVIVEGSYVPQEGRQYRPVNAGAEAWGYVNAPAPAAAPAAVAAPAFTPTAPLAPRRRILGGGLVGWNTGQAPGIVQRVIKG